MKRYRFVRVLKVAVFATLALTAAGFLVMGLWNVLMPGIFALRAISFWQALGLLLLSKILFGGFRPYRGGGPHWRRRMMERWEQMTPEEREKFKQGMGRGCGRRAKCGGAEQASRGAGMNSLHFAETEWAAALARGVRQCVVIGSRPLVCAGFREHSGPNRSVVRCG